MTHMFTDATSSLPIYSVLVFSDATLSLPDYSVRAFSDETSSLPSYFMRTLFWQIEIWSVIYTVYFNCKYFTSLYFIYAQAIRMPPRDFASRQNPCGSTKTAVGDHLRDMGHALDFSSSLINARENDTFKRRIREAIEMHCHIPTTNRDNGYKVPVIYQDVLSCGFHQTKSCDKTSNPNTW